MVNQSISRVLYYINIGVIPYAEAWELQRNIFEKRKEGKLSDVLLLLEHPHTYTLGKVAKREHLLLTDEQLVEREISVFDIDRGGDITYHGPGQIVGYPIISLNEWNKDSHKYLRMLEQTLIDVLGEYEIIAGRKEQLTGAWVKERKIAAIGIKISSWITMHGFALNVNTDLELFNGIVPCGIRDKDVTSMSLETGGVVSIQKVKDSLISKFFANFAYDNYIEMSLAELKEKLELY